jgi:hypothetical protein
MPPPPVTSRDYISTHRTRKHLSCKHPGCSMCAFFPRRRRKAAWAAWSLSCGLQRCSRCSSLAKFAAIRRASWSACWRQSGATQQHVRNRGISGSARLVLETTLMIRNGPQMPRSMVRSNLAWHPNRMIHAATLIHINPSYRDYRCRRTRIPLASLVSCQPGRAESLYVFNLAAAFMLSAGNTP